MEPEMRRSGREGGRGGMWIKVVEVALAMTILSVGIQMHSTSSSCTIKSTAFLEGPMIAIGSMLLLIAIVGMVAGVFRSPRLLWGHLAALCFLLLLLFCFSVFTVSVTTPGSGHPSPGKNYREYVFSDYSRWMRRRLRSSHRWNALVACLKDGEFCSRRLPYQGSNQSLYDHSPLSPIQSGCCKPPLVCNFTFHNATDWTSSTTPKASPDCSVWNNDPALLCYNCSSCKAGVIQATKDRWRAARVVLSVAVLIILMLYAFCGCALLRTDGGREYY